MTLQFLIDNWFLIFLAVGSGAALAWPSLAGRAGGGVSPAEAVNLINREKAVVIDVCEPAEHAAGHVAGSRNIPLGTLAEAKNLPTNKSLPLVVVCQSGARSGRAVGILKKMGFENARSLSGGLAAWRDANLPTERG